MKDVQNELAKVKLPIKKVGINKLVWPLSVKIQGDLQPTVAKFDMAVDLDKEIRGTHMSRFIETLKDIKILEQKSLEKILSDLKNRLKSKKSYLKVEFTGFINKTAPKSKKQALVDIECAYIANLGKNLKVNTFVKVPINTLCPCSKEISKYGAHNQRAIVSIEVSSNKVFPLEKLVEIADLGASTPIYSLLKRVDEQHVTEQAYENPMFVEDAVREIGLALEQLTELDWYNVSVESIESIHNHNAFACIEKNSK